MYYMYHPLAFNVYLDSLFSQFSSKRFSAWTTLDYSSVVTLSRSFQFYLELSLLLLYSYYTGRNVSYMYYLYYDKSCVVTKKFSVSMRHASSQDLFARLLAFLRNLLLNKNRIHHLRWVDNLSLYYQLVEATDSCTICDSKRSEQKDNQTIMNLSITRKTLVEKIN